jgi:hypothetical protein
VSSAEPPKGASNKFAVGDHVFWKHVPLVVCEVQPIGDLWVYACRSESAPNAEPLMYPERVLRKREDL